MSGYSQAILLKAILNKLHNFSLKYCKRYQVVRFGIYEWRGTYGTNAFCCVSWKIQWLGSLILYQALFSTNFSVEHNPDHMTSCFHSPLWNKKVSGEGNWSRSNVKSTHAIQYVFFISSNADKQFINFMGFSTGQANSSTDTTGKVQVSTEAFCFLVFVFLIWS